MDMFIATIKNIVLIVFFATVLEMFLPKSSLGKYVQLIIGLFVIVTILNPILSLKKADSQLELFAGGKTSQDYLARGLSNGLNLRENNEELVKEKVISSIKSQITALASLVPGVENVKVEIQVPQDFMGNGKINKVLIYLQPDSEDPVIETIDLSNSRESKSLIDIFPEETAQRVKETVANFYGLSMDTIEVVIK